MRNVQLAMYRQRLVDGPVVIFRQRGLGGSFNPNTIVPLGNDALIYPSRTVSSEWGELTVTAGGLRVLNGGLTAFVTAQDFQINASERTASGNGWRLKLTPGWTVKPGARNGDYEVVKDSVPPEPAS